MRFSAPTVLIVEDDAFIRRRLRRELSRAGARVAEARDGEEAVRRIVEGASFDLVLLALDMPQMNGAAAAWLLRQKDRIVRGGAVGRIVGMVEKAPPTEKDAVWFDAVVSKPLDRDTLDRLLHGCRGSVVASHDVALSDPVETECAQSLRRENEVE